LRQKWGDDSMALNFRALAKVDATFSLSVAATPGGARVDA